MTKGRPLAPAIFDDALFDADVERASEAGADAAFGVRHHPPESNAATVYEVAHCRLRG